LSIKGTLTEIIGAITESQTAIQGTGAMINPQQFGKVERTHTNNDVPIFEIEFDVVVTISDSSGTKAGIGIFMAGLGVGTKGELKESNISQNRIKFQIPVAYPKADENRAYNGSLKDL
jgi:hypothetical protein